MGIGSGNSDKNLNAGVVMRGNGNLEAIPSNL